MLNNKLDVIKAEWPDSVVVPPSVVAMCTTRNGGVSQQGFAGLNLAGHVQDDAKDVEKNRQLLIDQQQLPEQPQWLEQTHSIDVIDLDHSPSRQGDAAITKTPGRVAAVLTADCLPVLFCNRSGSEVAAAHAGWRGLLHGILEKTVASMQSDPGEIIAWLGPAIGHQQFEVGEEVFESFVTPDVEAETCFTQNRPGHYLADLYALARLRLNKAGVEHISGGNHCTYTDEDRFFSYRRESQTGRMASLIYIKKP